MHNSAVISAWSIDGFECLTRKLFTKMSIEQISRTENFIAAFVLFDEIYLPETYRNNEVVVALNSLSENSIKHVPSNDLINSDDMRDHISFDTDLHMLGFDKLAEKNDIWQLQNDPDLGYSLFFSEERDPRAQETLDSKFFTNLRLWHWCLASEMAELTNSVLMLPVSLNAVAEFSIKRKKISDLILKSYREYAGYHNQKYAKFSEVLTNPFISELKHFPPLFTVFLERCKNNDDAVLVLSELRKDYYEFRKIRHEFTNAVMSASALADQNEVVAEWDLAWQSLSLGEFKKPSLLRKKISSTDISSLVMSIETGGAKTLIKNVIDHMQYKKSYKRFGVFGNIEEEIGRIESREPLLRAKFGVEEVVPLIKI